ncbi:MAG TPA: AAA family ATPase [Pyrinomonadaceae bacterium]|nr:AAA family ATPase [Pyrinomonadaceae bacterium]
MAKQPFKHSNPCPICGGYDNMPRGKNQRCYGFLSDDSDWAHCTRAEYSGGLTQYPKSQTYGHKLVGNCKCGVTHNPSPATAKLKLSGNKQIAAQYDYRDEQGGLIYQVCRTEPKGFFQRRPDEHGGWIRNLDGVRRVLYRLPELLASDSSTTVFICEGEKDADALSEHGLLATTNSGGAGKWQDEYNETLNNRHVVILPDNDEAGREHAVKTANLLKTVAASVRLVELPGLPEKGDVSDWLNNGGTVKHLQEIVSSTPILEAMKPTTHQTGIQTAADLLAKEFPEPKFAVYGLFSEGVTIFAGKPKSGKSWCGLGIAIAVASGGRALDSIPVEQGDVLYLALEDGERRLQSRLQQILGDSSAPTKLAVATQWNRLDEGGLDDIEDWIISHTDARLIVIDTLKRVRPKVSRRTQLYDNDYEALAPLGDLARKYNVSIVVIHHTRKAESEDPLDLISGSFGLSGSADGVLVLKRAHGQADAALYATGRDFDSQEFALRWESSICGWKIIGDAGDLHLGKERKEIVALLKLEGTLTPKKTAARLNRNEGATRKLMVYMAKDGQLKNDGAGNYSIPVNDKDGNYSNFGNSTHSGNSGSSDIEETEGFLSCPPETLFGNSVSTLIQ